jgi:hypothetical protein
MSGCDGGRCDVESCNLACGSTEASSIPDERLDGEISSGSCSKASFKQQLLAGSRAGSRERRCHGGSSDRIENR